MWGAGAGTRRIFRRRAETRLSGYQGKWLRTVKPAAPGSTTLAEPNRNQLPVFAGTSAVTATEKVTNPFTVFRVTAFEQPGDGPAGGIETTFLGRRF